MDGVLWLGKKGGVLWMAVTCTSENPKKSEKIVKN
jgi:hypothetical protein